MSQFKPISRYLGIARGGFRKALLSALLQNHSDKNAFTEAKRILGEKCIYCGDSNSILQPDLLWPTEIGGLLVIGNVVPACPSCNSERGSKNWKEFIANSRRIAARKTRIQIDKQIIRIEKYMAANKQEKRPKLDDYLSTNELKILEELKLILDALTHGIRDKIETPQEKNIQFSNCSAMFDEFVITANRYRIKPT